MAGKPESRSIAPPMAQPEEALERGGSRMTEDFFRIVVAVATLAFDIQAGVVI